MACPETHPFSTEASDCDATSPLQLKKGMSIFLDVSINQNSPKYHQPNTIVESWAELTAVTHAINVLALV